MTARQVRWGSRFKWRVSSSSVDAYIAAHGRREDRSLRTTNRLDTLERRIAELGEGSLGQDGASAVRLIAERDDLRSRVVALEESLMNAREVAELQAAADHERSEVVRMLLDAVRSSDRADELRRTAITRLTEALAGYERPGHAGQLR